MRAYLVPVDVVDRRAETSRFVSLYALLSEASLDTAEAPSSISLEDMVLARLRAYARSLQGHPAKDMYGLIMPQLERPLVRLAMELAHGRQRHAAAMLGIHRNTLRTRLKELGLETIPRAKRRARKSR